MPNHEPRGPRAYAALAAWIVVACAAVALDWTRRQLAAPRATWRPLALAALAVALASAVTHAPLSWGPSHADAATAGDGLVGAMGAGVEAPAVEPGATVDPLLQPGHYASPRDDATVGPPAAEAEAGPAGEPLPAWMPPTVARWEAYIRAGAAPYGVDPALVAIVMTIESAGNPRAGSRAGARSLMQVMPSTARAIDDERGRPHDPASIEDPSANIDYGVYNLAWCLRTYGVANDDDWRQSIGRACRCYNGGPGAVNNPPAESLAHDRWVVGMWSERRDATSPTFDAWRAAGGQVALDIAATVDGPPMPADAPAAAAPWRDPFGPRVAPGVAAPYLQAMNGEVGR